MRDLQLLIQKCWSGTASPNELNELLQQLDKEEGRLLQAWMAEMNVGLDPSNPSPVFDKAGIRSVLLSKISADDRAAVISMSKSRTRIPRLVRISTAVAAACLLIVLSYHYLLPGSGRSDQQVADGSPMGQVIRTGNEQKEISLTDGSTVLIYEHSTLQYDNAYNDKERRLTLKGKARFTVKKDKSRPFTVYSGQLSTTALGTIFEVSENNDSTTVCLVEGSVKVQHYKTAPFNTVYLVPGQRAINRQNTDITVQSVSQDQPASVMASAKKNKGATGNKQLSFKQTPLDKVFKELEKRYAVSIRYNKEDISGIMFTGKFDENETCLSVLQAIGNLNNLEILSGKQEFIIKK